MVFSKPLQLIVGSMDRTVAWRLAISSLLAASGGLLAGLGPAALKHTIDAALSVPRPYAHSSDVTLFGGAYLLCLCVSRLIAEFRPAVSGVGEQRLYSALRRRFLRHAMALPLSFHLAQRSGSSAHALQQAITGSQIALLSASSGIAPVIIEGITVASVLSSLNQPALTLTFAVTAMAYVAATAARTAGLRNDAHAVSNDSAEVNGILTDALTNIEPIKCFGAEPIVNARYDRGLAQLEGSWRRLFDQRLRTGLATAAIFAASMGAAFAIAILGLRDGSLSIGGFVLVNVYLAQMVRPLELLATAARDLSTGFAFMRPLLEILQEPIESSTTKHAPGRQERVQAGEPARAAPQDELRSHHCGSRPPRHLAPLVRFAGVHIQFEPDRPVLADLTLNVGAGRSVGIVGASGCGKSSLARLLLRLHAPLSGEILLDGVPIDTLPLRVLRSAIAVVPQDTVLFNSTVAANIAIGKAEASAIDIQHAARMAGLHEFVVSLPLGYDTLIGERGLKLSGGERQRIAIARAVLRNPRIFVFDEATSMLDSATEAAILANLGAITADRTSIVIAHRLSAVRKLDEIAVIAGGRVAELGAHSALLAQDGLYAAMWRAQMSAGAV